MLYDHTSGSTDTNDQINLRNLTYVVLLQCNSVWAGRGARLQERPTACAGADQLNWI